MPRDITTDTSLQQRADGPPCILVVEDNAVQALDLCQQLREHGYRVVGPADSAARALELARHEWPALVLMDIRLQHGPDGIDLAEQLLAHADVPIVFLTAYSDPETVHRAARVGAYGFVTKPYDERELRAVVEVALAKAALERRPAAQERWFAHSLRCVQDGIVLTDAHARIRFLNPVAETWTGWSQSEAEGRELADVLRLEPASGAGAGDPAAVLRQAVGDGTVMPQLPAVAAVARDRSRRLLDVTAAPVHDGSRRIGTIVQLRDARARQAHDAGLTEGLERFRLAFERAPLGMALVASDGRVLEANEALCQLLGHARTAILGQSLSVLTAPADRAIDAQHLALLARAATTMVQFERRWLRADGSVLWCLTSVSRVETSQEQLPERAKAPESADALLLYQVVDFSAQREAAHAVAEVGAKRLRRDVDEAVDRTTHALLARASHELRTPLNAVLGFAQLLESAPDSMPPERVHAYAGYIVGAGKRLLELVDDLLDLQRAESGTLPLSMATVSLREELDAALSPVREAARMSGIGIEVEVPVALRVRADPKRLRQVLGALMRQAMHEARVGATVRWSLLRGEGPRARLGIKGLRPASIGDDGRHVFGLFGVRRDDPSGEGGPGLALARRLAERMGGSLTLADDAAGEHSAVLELRRAE